MAKKILVLSTSPRVGGNSDMLCDELARGVVDAGNEAEKLNVAKMKLFPCLACDACQTNGGTCVQKDDMASIIDKMKAADAVVFATPVYFYNMSAQMKIVIDRTYCCARTINFKKAAIIATSADGSKSSMDTTIEGFKGFLRCLNGIKNAGEIIATGVWNKGDVKDKKFMQQAYDMGKGL